MAIPTEKVAKRKKHKGFHGNLLKQWLVTKEKIEVRSLENGFLGSWHTGEVVGFGETRLRIKYENVLSNNGTANLVEWVPVSPVIRGESTENQDTINSCSRCNVRPVPPEVDLPRWSLHYGKCVDMQHEDAWWEGVILDHEDGCEERKVFFPDMGDEMTAHLKDLRLTQDWDEVTREWKPRGDWLLLELIEEAEQDWPLIVSVKQVWYDIRVKEGFKSLMEWTSPSRQIWKELLLEVIFNNLKFTAKSFFHDLNELEDMEQEANLSLEFSEPAFDDFLKHKTYFDDSVAIVPCGPDPLVLQPACFSDSVSPPVEKEITPYILALDQQNPQFEGNNLNNPMESHGGEGRAMSVVPPKDDHALVNGADLERPLISLKKPGKKRKRATRKITLEWLPALDDIVPEGEYCPSSVTDYIMYNGAKSNYPKIKILKAKRHLIYLGWKIEFAKDREIIRMRYISPSNVTYFSLLKACQAMQPESSVTSTNSEANLRDGLGASDILVPFPCTEESLPMGGMQSESISHYESVHVESNFNPQAVVDYISTSKPAKYKKAVMISKAKEHLAAIGWSFYATHRRGRPDMQYVSPNGHAFYSLRQACQWCTQQGTIPSHGEETGEPAAKALPFSSSRLEFRGDLYGNQLMDTNSMHLFSRESIEHAVGSHGTGKLKGKRKRGQSLDSCGLLLPSEIRKSKDLKIQGNDAGAEYSKCVLKVRQAISSSSNQTPRSILSRLIDGNVILPGVHVYYHGQKDVRPTKGRITREGIKCTCCQCIFTPGKFEAHAGSTCHRPLANIFLEDGRSLLECQLQLKLEKSLRSTTSERRQVKVNRLAIKNNDHICSSCNHGGELVLCDGCPSSFHASCIGLKEVPDGDWFCPSCCCGICLSSLSGCSESCIDEKALRCGQCEQKYHVGCFRSKSLTKLDGYTDGNWFCNSKCEQIYCSLQKFLGKPVLLGFDNLTLTWLKYTNCKDSNQGSQKNEGLLKNYQKLNAALSVLHECFKPVKEPLTRRDLVEDVIFNRWSELQRLNFLGFYTVLLERDGELITVATVRVHGDKVAEVPLIATRFQFRRKGMCRILMDEIEKKLMELGVENLVLPAVPSLLTTWTTSFGFSKMTESERIGFMRYIFLCFHGTSMCRKLLMNNRSSELTQSIGASTIACDNISNNDTVDVERSIVVFEVPQADLTEGSEMVDQGSSKGTSCNGGNLSSATSSGQIDDGLCLIQPNKANHGDSQERNDCTESLKCYKRRKLSTCRSQYPSSL